jgi:hypothetical protein
VICREPLDANQLAAKVFESLVIEAEASLDTAIRDAALGDEAPDDLFQYSRKIHDHAPACCTLISSRV